jgi:hypothetical protein
MNHKGTEYTEEEGICKKKKEGVALSWEYVKDIIIKVKPLNFLDKITHPESNLIP